MTAVEAVRRIRALRKYPLTQSAMAEKRILKSLTLSDYTTVIDALETPQTPQSQAPQAPSVTCG